MVTKQLTKIFISYKENQLKTGIFYFKNGKVYKEVAQTKTLTLALYVPINLKGENQMSTLGNLKLGTSKKPTSMPAIQVRRNKLSTKLWEQIQLAKSQVSGEPFQVTRFRSVRDQATGLKKQVEMPKRVRPWWFISEEGKVCLNIRYGSRTLEIAKGKPSVEVDNPNALIKALEVIKNAVEIGELDTQIEEASTHIRSRFKN